MNAVDVSLPGSDQRTQTAIRGDPFPVPTIMYPALAAILGWWAACFYLAWSPWSVLGGTFGLFLVGATLVRVVTIDSERGLVRQSDLLLGRWPASTQTAPLTEADAIVFQARRDADSGRRVFVGLRMRDGRRFWLKTFDAGEEAIGGPASGYARQLHKQLAIPIDLTIH